MSPRIASITRIFLYNPCNLLTKKYAQILVIRGNKQFNPCNHVDNKKYAQILVIRGDIFLTQTTIRMEPLTVDRCPLTSINLV